MTTIHDTKIMQITSDQIGRAAEILYQAVVDYSRAAESALYAEFLRARSADPTFARQPYTIPPMPRREAESTLRTHFPELDNYRIAELLRGAEGCNPRLRIA